MVDSRFFLKAGSLDLPSIASLTGAAIATASGKAVPASRLFDNVAPLDQAGTNDISFLDNVKYTDMFTGSKAGACFIRQKYAARAPEGMILLITETPYYAYALAARHFYQEPPVIAAISPLASIDSSATIDKGVRIDAGVVIGKGVSIGEGCWIGSNTVIDDGVQIGGQTRIGSLCSLSHAIIGKRVILHRGVHIGQDGFGFAPSPKGILKVPQVGRVVIADEVEIGSGTCIDRGAGPDTTVGYGTKIDNLVQIGHNVQIGKYVIIVSQCGIAGSTRIDDGAMLGGQVGLAGHVHIGAGAKLAAQAGVMADIPPGAAYGGSPAVPVKNWHRQTLAMAKLGKKES